MLVRNLLRIELQRSAVLAEIQTALWVSPRETEQRMFFSSIFVSLRPKPCSLKESTMATSASDSSVSSNLPLFLKGGATPSEVSAGNSFSIFMISTSCTGLGWGTECKICFINFFVNLRASLAMTRMLFCLVIRVSCIVIPCCG